MQGDRDVESLTRYTSVPYETVDSERESLLPTPKETKSLSFCTTERFNVPHILLAFFAGLLACGLIQYSVFGPECFSTKQAAGCNGDFLVGTRCDVLAGSHAGSTERHLYPPSSPINAFPTLFPTSVGYAGGTPTGAEPAIIATAPSYPIHTGAPQLVVPPISGHMGGKNDSKEFDLFKSWSNLSPWYSVGRTTFGLDSSPDVPETCRVAGLHFLHRHGARYPTAYASYGGPSKFAGRLHDSPNEWHAEGKLKFLNDWTYKLGEELLTPFGRQQLFDLGISIRLKYGFLLENFTESRTIPVFRTESQDRMLASARNFALGLFGYPFEGQYQQSITIEARGFNNTLAPYTTCTNANDVNKSQRGDYYTKRWAAIYLKDALARFQKQINGYELTIEDLYTMQQLCAYETVALGYSKFCGLFTEEEWDGFDYAVDLSFWYNSAFGSPVGRVQGIGYVQEMVARLIHTPIATHNSSTNATLDDDPITFPLNQSLYVDATHEVVVLNIITALNLTNFAASGSLPYDHIPPNRSFKVSQLAPFGTNVQFQLLECTSLPGQQIRVIINDGVTPLTGIKGCPKQKDGMCPVDTFVAAQKEIIAETDWNYECLGDWEVPAGPAWNTTTGSPPKP